MLKIVTLKQILNGLTNFEWAIDGIEPDHPIIGMIAGPGNVGKSWLALSLALSTASGKKWLGRFQTKKRKVLIVDLEQHEVLISVRTQRLVRGMELDDKTPLDFLIDPHINFLPAPVINPPTPRESLRELAELVELEGYNLVIIDSLIRAHSADENSNDEMRNVLEMAKWFIQETNASLLFVHHARKGGSGASGDRVRGASVIRDGCDWLLFCEKHKGGVKVVHDKARWAQAVEPFAVSFHGDDVNDTFKVVYAGKPVSSGQVTEKWLLSKLFDSGRTSRKRLVALASHEEICGERLVDKALKIAQDKEFLGKTTIERQAYFELTKHGDFEVGKQRLGEEINEHSINGA